MRRCRCPPMGMDTNVRVLVLEHGVGLTHDLTLACRHSGVSVLGPVRDAAEARAAAAEMPVDVLAVELTGPSVQIVRDANVALGGVRVLVVTADLDPEVGASVIAAGAAGLIARSDDERTVPDLLRRTAAGELILPAAHLAALVELVRVSRLDANDGARIDALTRREREVLALLADGHTTQEVSAALSISVMTVQSHVKNVLAKLGVHSKVEAIRFAWRSGVLAMPASA
jgi:DNA-binding NarL/FixJ family response regulator